MRCLAFSDLHRDLRTARELVDRSAQADVVLGVGDFASVHSGLEETMDALSAVERPFVAVPGNNETDEALRAACGGWATVLHGESVELEGVTLLGLGAGIPTTPWDWSFDLTEEEAEAKLASCPEGAVLLSHSPPKGHVDKGLGESQPCCGRSRRRARRWCSAATSTSCGGRSRPSGPPRCSIWGLRVGWSRSCKVDTCNESCNLQDFCLIQRRPS